MRIDALPRRWATETPGNDAIDDGTRRVDWKALVDSIDACAAMLTDAQVRSGDRVMIVAENSVALIAALFAVSTLGACAVIVNARLSPRELDGIRDHAMPRRIVYATGVTPEIDEHARRHDASPVDVPSLGTIALSPLHAGADSVSAPETEEDVASIVYTSGTSGRPKGVMLTHRNLTFVATTSAQLRRIRPTDQVFGALPIYHVYGLASVLLGTFCAGACLNIVVRFDAQRALHLLAHGLTIFQGVPAMYARMLEQLVDGARVDAPRLRYLYAGGSPLDRTLKAEVERRFGLPLHNGYGLTECSPTVSQTRLDAPRDDTSVGPPIPDIEIRIVAAEGVEMAPGDIGELWVRGPNVMRGYYRDPEATAEVLTTEGWLKTGDLARQHADGALFIVGRSKELIIRSGLNVYPIEVETVLNTHPAVSQSVVVGRQVDGGNEEVVAFVELAAGQQVDSAALAAHAAGQLAPYKRPAEIHVMNALPASATGKVLRGQLKALAQSQRSTE